MYSSSLAELHEIARKFTISKSWFYSTHYTIIHPLKLEEIERYLWKNKGKGK